MLRVSDPDPPVPPRAPPGLVAWLARGLLRLFGWRVDLVWPEVPKAVIVVYPHTSNWDFVVGMLARYAAGLPLTWMGKDAIFRWPFGAALRRLGGIPVDRGSSHGMVAQMKAEFARRPFLWLALAPEGTRARTDRLRSGFYHLALAARVPLGLGYLDYRRRVVGVGGFIPLTGDRERDLDRLRAFYADKTARKPAQAGAIRLVDGA